jgi:hypothetical protein
MPLVRHDWTALVEQLRAMPHPVEKAGHPILVLSLDAEWIEEEKNYLLRVLEASGYGQFFSRVEFLSCRIPPDESVYLRHAPKDKNDPSLKYGWKSGPNIQFFRSVAFVAQSLPQVCSLLLMETDLIPLEAGWLDRLNSELAGLDGCLIAGARYQGETVQSKRLKDHINGNAVLNLSHPDFREFFAAWEALLIECMPLAPENPYDVIIEWALSKKRTLSGQAREWASVMERLYLPGKRYLNSIVNLGGPHEALSGYRFPVADTLERFPEMVLLHCRAALPYAGQLRARKAGDDACAEDEFREDEEDSRMTLIAQAVLANTNRGPGTASSLAKMYARKIHAEAALFERQLQQNRALRQAFALALNGADVDARKQLLGAMLQHDLIL